MALVCLIFGGVPFGYPTVFIFLTLVFWKIYDAISIDESLGDGASSWVF